MSVKEIAQHLGIAPETIEHRVENVRSRCAPRDGSRSCGRASWLWNRDRRRRVVLGAATAKGLLVPLEHMSCDAVGFEAPLQPFPPNAGTSECLPHLTLTLTQKFSVALSGSKAPAQRYARRA